MNKEVKKVNKKSDNVFLEELEKFKKIFPQFVKEVQDKNGEIVKEIDFDSFKTFLDTKQNTDKEVEKYFFSWSERRKYFY